MREIYAASTLISRGGMRVDRIYIYRTYIIEERKLYSGNI